MKRYLAEIMAALLLVLAVLGVVHQHLFTNDVWFHFRQLKNHETIIACCIVAAVALLIGKYLGRHLL